MRYFRPDEFGPGWGRLDLELLQALDELRELVDAPIVIHADGIVSPRTQLDSQHPLGRAVDCHAVGLPLLDFWLAAERLPAFRGIGLYPYWTHPGLHLDTRRDRRRARWWRDREGRYRALDASALRALMKEDGLWTSPPSLS